jgi:hypothetical protein
MDTLRLLIQEKLMDGRLPVEPMPRVWGGPGNGEKCDACDEKVEKSDLVVEGGTERGRVVFFHAKCFYVWEKERIVVAHERSTWEFERNKAGQPT